MCVCELLKHSSVSSALIKYIRPVFVSRSDQDSRRKTVEEIKRRAHSGGAWPQIMIFPEGTCTNRSCLITFKPGAFIPAVPVQPVVIRYPNKLADGLMLCFRLQDTITWTWQGPGAFKILWLTLCQLHNEFEIEYLPIYSPSEEEKKNPALFAHNVRRLMAKALQVPVTDYSFEDCQLAMAEGQIRLPVDTCLLEFAKLVRSLGLKRANSEKLLQDYGKRAAKLQGQRLSLEDFAQFLDLPVSDELRHMFALFDENEDHSMDVREFVIAFSVVCRPAKTLDTIRLAFQMFEAEEDGAITENELMCILRTALGVGELKVGRLFRAVDEEDSGKITFVCCFPALTLVPLPCPVLAESFREFADQHPDFAEQYLYSDNAGFGSSSPSHAANGFCADFSPSEQKKLD
ncbi:Lysophosphatidylcholine acyltransferase 1 [Labeo rohita]|uniref:Lysophosphatidylcholine acyltransferase 1 n=1 Tax=Labeo rohita TaxID=84645 RepID=A0ABQ8LZM8_LABRO|nr:Lysophosphatidylcholine acyltransferase 1 [Labeo rohita]